MDHSMLPLFGKCVWLLGVVGWFVIRYPYDRRARKTPKVKSNLGLLERALLTISTCGLGIIPMAYVVSPVFAFADYRFSILQFVAGTVVFAYGLWLFRRTHKDLGRNWSVTLEVRDQHKLVTNGVYNRVRHPMYAAFWLWALAQALLLPNWIAGLSGLIGFGTLFFLRVGHEEQMMTDAFGDEYRSYMQRTARILPGVY
jgi:protein-S-isoprenylcysteine O-methyltransferase Ste14